MERARQKPGACSGAWCGAEPQLLALLAYLFMEKQAVVHALV